jgi:hypothetical protein
MGLFDAFGGGAKRAARDQIRALRAQQFREQEALRLQAEAVNAQRLDLFEKDRLAEEAERQAFEQLNTPGATILLGGDVTEDPELASQRRAAFFANNTRSTL